MYTKGFILYSTDNEYDPTLIALAFDTDEFELEKKMEKLNENDQILVDRFHDQNKQIDNYISSFQVEWDKTRKAIRQDSTLPIPKKKPESKEEHAEYKKIKDLNLEINSANRSRIDNARRQCLIEWMNQNPSNSEIEMFIKVSDEFTLNKVLPNSCSCSYFISAINKPVQEEY